MVKYFKLSGLSILKRSFEFNFTKGSYLFCGTNGVGKTTVLDSLHPFDTFISREKSIRDVLNPGGMKEIVLDRLGEDIRVRILKRRSNDEFAIYQGSKEMLTTSSVTRFKTEIESLFPPKMFDFLHIGSNSVVLSQVGNVELKRRLLSLANDTQFAEIRTAVKTQKETIERELLSLEGQLLGLLNTPQTMIIKESSEELQTMVAQLRVKQDRLAVVIAELEQNRQEFVELSAERSQSESLFSALNADIETIVRVLPSLEQNKKRVTVLPARVERQSLLDEKLQKLASLESDEARQLQYDSNKLSRTRSAIEQRVQVSEQYANLPCDGILQKKCPLVPGVIEPLDDLQRLLGETSRELSGVDASLREVQSHYAEMRNTFTLEKRGLDNEINELKNLEKAVAVGESNKARLTTLQEQAEALRQRMVDLSTKLTECEFNAEELAQYRTESQQCFVTITSAAEKIKWKEQIESMSEVRAQLEESIKEKKGWLEAYLVLDKVFSVNEFPALELIKVLTQVSESTNRLLAAYNPSFSVHLGLKADSRQTLDTLVYMDGIATQMSDLSTGQRTWVDKFLKLGFGLMTRIAHPYYDTLYCDEGDGALHPSVREDFLRIHNDLTKTSFGFNQVFIVSHDPRAPRLFDNVITF